MHLSLSGIHKLTQFLYLNDPFKNNSFTHGNLAFRLLELNFREHSTKFVLWPLFYRSQTFTQLIFPVCELKIAETNRFTLISLLMPPSSWTLFQPLKPLVRIYHCWILQKVTQQAPTCQVLNFLTCRGLKERRGLIKLFNESSFPEKAANASVLRIMTAWRCDMCVCWRKCCTGVFHCLLSPSLCWVL